MTGKENNRKSGRGTNVLARKPHGIFTVSERVKVGNDYITVYYDVKDFTSKTL